MEAPTTSSVEAVTMIAPKRAIMIDKLARAVNATPELSPEDQIHPAFGSRGPNSRAADRRARVSALTTCSTCRMTYLPSAVPQASLASRDPVCDGCEQSLG
jgi:hypothetical protein